MSILEKKNDTTGARNLVVVELKMCFALSYSGTYQDDVFSKKKSDLQPHHIKHIQHRSVSLYGLE